MGTETHIGSVWPDAAGTPTDPTVAYAVAGPTINVREETEWGCEITVGTAACRAVGISVQIEDVLGAWRTIIRKTIQGGTIGVHPCFFSVPQWCNIRIVPRRWGGTANTTFVVDAFSRKGFGHLHHDGQPLELAVHHVDGLECWGDGAGGAAVMAAGPGGHVPAPPAAADQLWIPTGEADTLVIDFTTTVLAPASVEIEVREQPTGSAAAVEQPAVNSVVAGVVAQQIAQEQIVFGALDVRRSREIHVRPGMEILVLAQRTGGGAGTEGYGVARLYRLGR